LGLIPLTQLFLIFPKFTCKFINWGNYLNYPKEPTWSGALNLFISHATITNSNHQNSLVIPNLFSWTKWRRNGLIGAREFIEVKEW
jgi:hypothetical protein